MLIRREYCFSTLAADKYIVFDIGLNIGITALYLAQQKDVVKVYGFEPFPETFAQAENNLRLNPMFASKIEIFNYGLSDKESQLPIHYNSTKPGSMSTTIDRFPDADNLVTVTLKRASTVIAPIIANSNAAVVLKIDCEGSEGAILNDLAANGVLQNVEIIIMEWHFVYPDSLINLLNDNGFIVFCQTEKINELGMIRAVRVRAVIGDEVFKNSYLK